MAREPRKTFTVENAQFKYRNFSGRPTPFNKQGGDRTCTIVLDDDKVARQMAKDGWNVKFPKDDETGDQDTKIDVKLKYDTGMPPRVVCVTSTNRFDMDEDMVGLLDGMDISYVDLTCNSYFYELADGRSGIAAYLKKMVVVIEEDELDKKWGLNDHLGHSEQTVEQV